jgi:hypothetical protein
MTTARIRALVAASAAAAVLVHGLVAHGLPHMSDDAMAGAAVGLCLVLATTVASAAAPKAKTHQRVVLADAVPAYVAARHSSPLDGKARASPSALSRFRN